LDENVAGHDNHPLPRHLPYFHFPVQLSFFGLLFLQDQTLFCDSWVEKVVSLEECLKIGDNAGIEK